MSHPVLSAGHVHVEAEALVVATSLQAHISNKGLRAVGNATVHLSKLVRRDAIGDQPMRCRDLHSVRPAQHEVLRRCNVDLITAFLNDCVSAHRDGGVVAM